MELDKLVAEKTRLREIAFLNSPKTKERSDGSNMLLTQKERIVEADIIYKWLIKDL